MGGKLTFTKQVMYLQQVQFKMPLNIYSPSFKDISEELTLKIKKYFSYLFSFVMLPPKNRMVAHLYQSAESPRVCTLSIKKKFSIDLNTVNISRRRPTCPANLIVSRCSLLAGISQSEASTIMWKTQSFLVRSLFTLNGESLV